MSKNYFNWQQSMASLLLLAGVAATPSFAQENKTNTKQEEVKVLIIKKTIDEKGNETIERIEKSGNSLEELKLDGLDIKELQKEGDKKEIRIEKHIMITNEDKDEIKKALTEKKVNNGKGCLEPQIGTDKQVVIIEDGKIKDLGKEMEGLKDLHRIEKKFDNNRPFLGISIEKHESGVKITEVHDKGAAQAAGLQVGDVVTHIDGNEVKTIDELIAAIGKRKIGEEAKITYLRAGESKVAAATLQKRPAQEMVFEQKIIRGPHREHSNFRCEEGFDPCKALADLKGQPFIGVYINTDKDGNGATISKIIEKTAAERSSLKADDVIIKFNKKAVSDYNSLTEALKDFKPGDNVRITYLRGDKESKTKVTLGSMADREPRRVKILTELCEQDPKNAVAKKSESKKIESVTTAPELEVFPNPTTGMVSIKFDGTAEPMLITVVSIEGKEVMKMKLTDTSGKINEQIDLSKLAKGVYVVNIQQGKNNMSKQVVVQ